MNTHHIFHGSLYGTPTQSVFCAECEPARHPNGTWGDYTYQTWEPAPKGSKCQCLGSACIDLEYCDEIA